MKMEVRETVDVLHGAVRALSQRQPEDKWKKQLVLNRK